MVASELDQHIENAMFSAAVPAITFQAVNRTAVNF
jgi:hypothetical protein